MTNNRALAWVFVVVAAAVFVVRGPMRAVWWSDDYAVPYAGSRALLLGVDPYQADTIDRVLIDAGRETGPDGRAATNSSVYLPPTLVPAAPLALLPWRVSRIAWLCLNLVLIGWMIRSALSLADLQIPRFARDDKALWLTGGILALAPLHTGVAVGQIAIPSVALAVVAMALIKSGRQAAGGLALGISILLKPQLTGPFLVYYFLRRGRRAAVVAALTGLVATVLSVGWLELHGVPWFASWSSVMGSIIVPGSQHDPAGPFGAQMLELRTLLVALGTGAPSWVGFVVAAVAGAWLYFAGRNLDERHDMLLLSGVAVLSLLAMYHRFYDATLLVIPMVWLVASGWWPDAGRKALTTKHQSLVTICLAVFFLPGAWAMQRFAMEGRLPQGLTQSWVWNAVLLRHQNWALVVLFAVIATAILRSRRSTPLPSDARK